MDLVMIKAAEKLKEDLHKLLTRAVAKQGKKKHVGKTEADLRDEYEAGIISLTKYEKNVAVLNETADPAPELTEYIRLLKREIDDLEVTMKLEKGEPL